MAEPSQPPRNPLLPERASLVSLTVHSIQAHLRAGHWPQQLPAERQLSRYLQVSRPTLRAALQQLEREGVIRLTGRTRRCVSPVDGPTHGEGPARVVVLLAPWPLRSMPATSILLIDTLREKLARLDYILELLVEPACFSARPEAALKRSVAEGATAAAWMAFGSKAPMQQWFVRQRMPLLVIGSCGPGSEFSSVDCDFRAACRHAGNLLWRKGHRRVALVLPADAYDGDLESEQALREALTRHPGATLHVLRHDGSAVGLCALLDRTMGSTGAPTGYFVVRAVHALTVATHLLHRGLRLPQDVAVLSRDDELYLRHTSPPLSRYSVNPDQFARKVSKAVVDLVENGGLAPRRVRLIPEFVPGGTL